MARGCGRPAWGGRGTGEWRGAGGNDATKVEPPQTDKATLPGAGSSDQHRRRRPHPPHRLLHRAVARPHKSPPPPPHPRHRIPYPSAARGMLIPLAHLPRPPPLTASAIFRPRAPRLLASLSLATPPPPLLAASAFASLPLRALLSESQREVEMVGESEGRPLRVGLVCGGPSPERGISLNSARSVLDHIQARTHLSSLFTTLSYRHSAFTGLDQFVRFIFLTVVFLLKLKQIKCRGRTCWSPATTSTAAWTPTPYHLRRCLLHSSTATYLESMYYMLFLLRLLPSHSRVSVCSSSFLY